MDRLANAPKPGPDPARTRHFGVLLASILVMVLALLLEVLPDGRVAFRGLTEYPLPPSCPARTLFGISCPGCGLTRAIVLLAHAEWSGSFRTHRLGWLIAALIAAQVPYRALALRRPGRSPLGPVASTVLASVLFTVYLGNWACDQIGLVRRVGAGPSSRSSPGPRRERGQPQGVLLPRPSDTTPIVRRPRSVVAVPVPPPP